MLKNINIILVLIVTVGILYSSHIILEPDTIVIEQSLRQGYDTPSPGSEGDEWEYLNELLGP